eukprot:GHRQ01016179.1.p1 GENE.GHRQ01016179.1~~GHRQ01016179.1.p1  ORF type:complete len:116 (+),score=14.12 GHRQ01016179.1:434-781(+)
MDVTHSRAGELLTFTLDPSACLGFAVVIKCYFPMHSCVFCCCDSVLQCKPSAAPCITPALVWQQQPSGMQPEQQRGSLGQAPARHARCAGLIYSHGVWMGGDKSRQCGFQRGVHE